VAGEAIRLSAALASPTATAQSPVVVLREGREATRMGKAAGPSPFPDFGCPPQSTPAPVLSLSNLDDELLAW